MIGSTWEQLPDYGKSIIVSKNKQQIVYKRPYAFVRRVAICPIAEMNLSIDYLELFCRFLAKTLYVRLVGLLRFKRIEGLS